MRLFILLLISCLLLVSCADKYRLYKSQYNFKSVDGSPDYSQPEYWAAYPSKHDPSDSIPAPLINEPRDSSVDVFFLHPTTFTDKRSDPSIHNAAIDDAYINAKTDYSTILYQATAFNQHARVFAPRYRQAHIRMFFEKDTAIKKQTFDLAYADIKSAFAYYLQQENHGRPVIIAAHSQGSLLALQLLKDFFEGKALKKQLVAAYIIGWPVTEGYFQDLKICEDSLQTGCICSWRTLKKNFLPGYIKNEAGHSLVTNPLTWKTSGEHAGRELNEGSILRNFNRLYPHTTDAQVARGVLWVKKPKFPGSFLIHSRNYHVGDINLYYMNIRRNVEIRIKTYLNAGH
ncbi:MAG: DUF3089 domain-containing protein [Terrimonas sp.]|nr:DUF3089 domain-containing protein [Terrimonas sp.]